MTETKCWHCGITHDYAMRLSQVPGEKLQLPSARAIVCSASVTRRRPVASIFSRSEPRPYHPDRR
jgi:hypothetical protein